MEKNLHITAKIKETKAAAYTWGEFKGVETFSGNEDVLSGMEMLDPDDLLGFTIRKEDEEKVFMADPDYIDRGADGTSIKYAYAIKMEVKKEWK